MDLGKEGWASDPKLTQAYISLTMEPLTAADFYEEGVFLAQGNKISIHVGLQATLFTEFTAFGQVIDIRYIPSLQCIATIEISQGKPHFVMYFNWDSPRNNLFVNIPTSINLGSTNNGSDIPAPEKISVITSECPFAISITLDTPLAQSVELIRQSLLSVNRAENSVGILVYVSPCAPTLIKLSVSKDCHFLHVDGIMRVPSYDGWTRKISSDMKEAGDDGAFRIRNLSVCGKYVALGYEKGGVVCFKVVRRTKRHTEEEGNCIRSMLNKVYGLDYVETRYKRMACRRPVTHINCLNDGDKTKGKDKASLLLLYLYKGDGNKFVCVELIPKYEVRRVRKNRSKPKTSTDQCSFSLCDAEETTVKRKLSVEILEVGNFSCFLSSPRTGSVIAYGTTSGVYQAVVDGRFLYLRAAEGVAAYVIPNLGTEETHKTDLLIDEKLNNQQKHLLGDLGIKLPLCREMVSLSPSAAKELVTVNSIPFIPLFTFRIPYIVGLLVSKGRIISLVLLENTSSGSAKSLGRTASGMGMGMDPRAKLNPGSVQNQHMNQTQVGEKMNERPFSVVQHGVTGRYEPMYFQASIMGMTPISPILHSLLKSQENRNPDPKKTDPKIYILIASAAREARQFNHISDTENIALWEVERFALYMFGKIASISVPGTKKSGARALAYSGYPADTCLPLMSDDYIHVYSKNVFKDLAVVLQVLNPNTAGQCLRVTCHFKPQIIGTMLKMPGRHLIDDLNAIFPGNFAVSNLNYLIAMPHNDVRPVVDKAGFFPSAELLSRTPRVLLDKDAEFMSAVSKHNPLLVSTALYLLMSRDEMVCRFSIEHFVVDGASEELLLAWESTLCAIVRSILLSECVFKVDPAAVYHKLIEIMLHLINTTNPDPLRQYGDELSLPHGFYDHSAHKETDANRRREAMLFVIYNALKHKIPLESVVSDDVIPSLGDSLVVTYQYIQALECSAPYDIQVFIDSNIEAAIHIIKTTIKGKDKDEASALVQDFLLKVLETDNRNGDGETVPLLKVACRAFTDCEIGGDVVRPKQYISLLPPHAPLQALVDEIEASYLTSLSKSIDAFLLEEVSSVGKSGCPNIMKYVEDIAK